MLDGDGKCGSDQPPAPAPDGSVHVEVRCHQARHPRHRQTHPEHRQDPLRSCARTPVVHGAESAHTVSRSSSRGARAGLPLFCLRRPSRATSERCHAEGVDDDAPLSPQELATTLTTLVVIAGQAQAGRLPLDLSLQLRQRLVGLGVLPPSAPLQAAWEVVGEVIQHLHQLNTLDAPSPAPVVPVENLLAFPDEQSAQDFTEVVRAAGKDVDAPVHEEWLRRWTVVIRSPRPTGRGAPSDVGLEARVAIERGGWHLGAR